MIMKQTMTLYKERRDELVRQAAGLLDHTDFAILLIAAFEQDRVTFRQESSFYYFTGIQEPASVAVIEASGKTTIFIPDYKVPRAQWMSDVLIADAKHAAQYGVEDIKLLGSQVPGYRFSPLADIQAYSELIKYLADLVQAKNKICVAVGSKAYDHIDQKYVLEKLQSAIHGFSDATVTIAALVGLMRRKKSTYELEQIYKAIQITTSAHETVAQVIKEGKNESELHAAINYVFLEAHAREAFPSIVASGKYATVLHYHDNNHVMNKSDMVVVDIGAEYNYYCADLTRTYPVSGKFSKRQQELYNLVLEAQELVASHAKPGIWLNNPEKPDQSLHHVALQFFAQHNLAQYFVHGIGHYLGMDVHDVGSLAEPLAEGDVITIEPGLYIPEENIGIRIEDNYWIIKDGSMCLSEDLPKSVNDIQKMMQEVKEK